MLFTYVVFQSQQFRFLYRLVQIHVYIISACLVFWIIYIFKKNFPVFHSVSLWSLTSKILQCDHLLQHLIHLYHKQHDTWWSTPLTSFTSLNSKVIYAKTKFHAARHNVRTVPFCEGPISPGQSTDPINQLYNLLVGVIFPCKQTSSSLTFMLISYNHMYLVDSLVSTIVSPCSTGENKVHQISADPQLKC